MNEPEFEALVKRTAPATLQDVIDVRFWLVVTSSVDEFHTWIEPARMRNKREVLNQWSRRNQDMIEAMYVLLPKCKHPLLPGQDAALYTQVESVVRAALYGEPFDENLLAT